jgi:hypothetical protein
VGRGGGEGGERVRTKVRTRSRKGRGALHIPRRTAHTLQNAAFCTSFGSRE